MEKTPLAGIDADTNRARVSRTLHEHSAVLVQDLHRSSRLVDLDDQRPFGGFQTE
jgi:hypothetical protein